MATDCIHLCCVSRNWALTCKTTWFRCSQYWNQYFVLSLFNILRTKTKASLKYTKIKGNLPSIFLLFSFCPCTPLLRCCFTAVINWIECLPLTKFLILNFSLYPFFSIMIADANWSKWSKYGPCSKPCGGGSQYRSRKCENPTFAYNTRDCVGSNRESRRCNTHPCKGKVSC